MAQSKCLNVFVDESGRFAYPDDEARFYIVSMILHEPSCCIDDAIEKLEHAEASMGLANHCFHAGPLIRQERGYAIMSRSFRGRIFARMMSFAAQIPFSYRHFLVDKKYITSQDDLKRRLENDIATFLAHYKESASQLDEITIYYDSGQTPLTNLLHGTFSQLPCKISFAQNVRPQTHRLIQLADLICTVSLIDAKIASGVGMSLSEKRFFGGERAFKRNVLRKLRRHAI